MCRGRYLPATMLSNSINGDVTSGARANHEADHDHGAGVAGGCTAVYRPGHITELGVSPGGIPHKQLTAERLAQVIGVMVTNTSMRARAAALGERLQAEDGVGSALKVIEQVLKMPETLSPE